MQINERDIRKNGGINEQNTRKNRGRLKNKIQGRNEEDEKTRYIEEWRQIKEPDTLKYGGRLKNKIQGKMEVD